MLIYQLTISDRSDFNREVHCSVWDTYENAQLRGFQFREEWATKPENSDFPDSLDFSISEYLVRDASDL